MAHTHELFTLDPSVRVDASLFANESLDTTAQKVYLSTQDDLFCIRLRQIAWNEFREKKTPQSTEESDIGSAVISTFEDAGLREIVANMAIRLSERNHILHSKNSWFDQSPPIARRSVDEPLNFLRESRESWELALNEEILSIVSESKRSFMKQRPHGSKCPHLDETSQTPEDFQSPTFGASDYQAKETPKVASDKARFIFDSDDVYETIISLRNPNVNPKCYDRCLGQVKVFLATPNCEDLHTRYQELSCRMTQLGLDETNSTWGSRLSISRHEEAELTTAFGTILEARKFLRRGVSV